MSPLFRVKTISRKTQRSKYIHIIIIISLCTLSSLWLLWKFTFEWSDLRQCEEQSRALEWWDRTTSRSRWTADLSIRMEDCWLRIRFYIFWLAPLCRPWSEDFQLYLSALLSSPASPLCWFYFLPLCWFLFFWIWFFFCFHHSRRRIKWFTRGECFCRRIIWQENCFQGRGPPLTMRLMMMMCQKCFCLLKTS